MLEIDDNGRRDSKILEKDNRLKREPLLTVKGRRNVQIIETSPQTHNFMTHGLKK